MSWYAQSRFHVVLHPQNWVLSNLTWLPSGHTGCGTSMGTLCQRLKGVEGEDSLLLTGL
jgi:hypothetical protein